jgi:hypothetical protein
MTVALIALFVAMGGTGYAAFKLPQNSVGTKQLKKNAVTGAKVKNRSLTGADINAGSLGSVPNAHHADDASNLDGLGASQFVRGGGTTLAARVVLGLGGGGLQHVLTVPGWGEVVGGCGSGGGVVGFVNHSGGDLRVYPYAGGDLAPVTVGDGSSSGLFPSGVGSAGYTWLQIGSTDSADQRLLTVTATRDAEVSNNCPVQALATTK